MPTTLNRARVKQHLDNLDLRALFINELGWDYGGSDIEVIVHDCAYPLQAIAHKRGFVVYLYIAQSGGGFPGHATRQKIERSLAKHVREHLIIFCRHDRSAQYWLWVKREPGRAERSYRHIYNTGQSGESLIQKLELIVFTLDEEADVTIVDANSRVRAAFDVEKVTKRFYERFKEEHQAFMAFIEGLHRKADRKWYASLMLNRMMFIYFIQKRGFLDNNPDYLRHRLRTVRQQHGSGKFAGFYRLFLLKLFHEGLGQPEAERDPGLVALLGQVPYLNGGLFDVHDLERDHPNIDIPDEAFEKIFAFFDAYQWHLDDHPLRNDNEINPDVLGFIFEKYINQKQMDAYYTKEDITGYISRNTIIPFLFDRAKKGCSTAFTPDGGVWRLLQEDPDSYFYAAVRHGITYDIHNKKELDVKQELPAGIAAGLDNVAQRGGWNEAAPDAYALPTETWREHVARRRRYEEIHAKLAAGEVTSINDLITYNLNIEKFALDVIANSEGSELVSAFWKAIASVSVLDPTCGSGAFLFAALNILEPLYSACLEAMEGFLDDLKRSRRKHSPLKLSNFKEVIKEVDKHASKDYFILKSIIINNLYGVDIMEEAVEICKLRLFLKLVAQLETYDQIEPLPDIDFNVRAGNTLVGFTTLQEIRDSFVGTPGGQSRILYPEEEEELRRIEEDAEIADRQFQLFHEMQTEYGMDVADFADAKLELRQRLGALRSELDRYLAKEYGVVESDQEAYAQWLASHQPFHWFVEFYGIMHNGGFDVIVGNPPFVEYSTIRRTYTISDYVTERCGNLYAYTMERSLLLLRVRGRFSFVTPISLTAAQRMAPLQTFLFEQNSVMWLSNFALRPAALFPGVMQRISICITQKGANGVAFTTDYITWYAAERPTLFHRMRYLSLGESRQSYSIPKVNDSVGHSALIKALSHQSPWASYKQFKGNHITYYHNAGGYWVKTFTFPPYYRSLKDPNKKHTTISELRMPSSELAALYCAVLNSNLHYFFWKSSTDARHVYPSDIAIFPIRLNNLGPMLSKLSILVKDLMTAMNQNSQRIIYGKAEVDQYDVAPCKPIIDEIDCVLAKHYDFTDEELDFIINYDIKYRMGL